MEIVDGWSRADTFSLDREGFALKEFYSAFDRFDDDEAVRNQFYATSRRIRADRQSARGA